jgi:hypothetical protein
MNGAMIARLCRNVVARISGLDCRLRGRGTILGARPHDSTDMLDLRMRFADTAGLKPWQNSFAQLVE